MLMEPGFRQRLLVGGESPRALVRWAALALLGLGKVRQLVVNEGYRAETLARWRYGGKHFQGSAYTRADRYPALFAYARQELGTRGRVHVLSFGCATGEEVFTLARYLPEARITGVDINPWCLEQGRGKNADPKVEFLHAQSVEFAALGELDAIFCMAVFQRTENFEAVHSDGGFRFAHFAEAVAMLDGKLKAGGLLFVDHCDFSFADTPTAAGYRVADFAENVALRKRPLFGPDDRRKADVTMLPRVFRKVG